ncbi:trypsin-like peptidase [Flavobacterium sp. 1]|uniref:trypsin-like peptidase domain-containing protein n=1 Tax=Flavobacterium sp. 1 TaxID=2035200 RepID=UPI000CABD4EA|nr:trypsin-like peptidase domain-containing protein [Flavobacterium sp. 1]PJJ10261.1 trypsin-like peptidase [Flavobacterium sp. 1]
MKKTINPHPLSFVTIPVTMHLKETKALLYSGTSFIYNFNDKHYLITNWHIVTGLNPTDKKPIMSHGGIPDIMVLSFLLNDKKVNWKTFTLEIYINGKADWLIHPIHKEKVDVIAIEIEIPEDFNCVVRPINNYEFHDFDLEIADDVFVLGYPYSFTGGGNFPIWKKGSVATEPEIDYEGLPKFFIDTASKPGMSGSPVIFRRNGIHLGKEEKLTNKTMFGEIRDFVGVYSGRVIGESDFDAQLGVVWKKHVIEEIIKGNIKEERNFV